MIYFFAIATESYRKQRQPGRRSRLSGITIDHVPNSSVRNLQQMVHYCPPAAAIMRRQTATVFGIPPPLHGVDDASIAANRVETAAGCSHGSSPYVYRQKTHPMPHIFWFFICLAKAMISCKDSRLHDGGSGGGGSNRTQFLAVIKTIPKAERLRGHNFKRSIEDSFPIEL